MPTANEVSEDTRGRKKWLWQACCAVTTSIRRPEGAVSPDAKPEAERPGHFSPRFSDREVPTANEVSEDTRGRKKWLWQACCADAWRIERARLAGAGQGVAEQALFERSENILLSGRQRVEGFPCLLPSVTPQSHSQRVESIPAAKTSHASGQETALSGKLSRTIDPRGSLSAYSTSPPRDVTNQVTSQRPTP